MAFEIIKLTYLLTYLFMRGSPAGLEYGAVRSSQLMNAEQFACSHFCVTVKRH